MPRGAMKRAKKADGPKSKVPGVAWDRNEKKWRVRLSKGPISSLIARPPQLVVNRCRKAEEEGHRQVCDTVRSREQDAQSLGGTVEGLKNKKHRENDQM